MYTLENSLSIRYIQNQYNYIIELISRKEHGLPVNDFNYNWAIGDLERVKRLLNIN